MYGTFYETYYPFHSSCSTYENDDMLNSTFIENLKFDFDKKCLGNHECKLNYNVNDLNKDCIKEVFERSKSSISTKLYDQFYAENHDLT